MKNYDGRLLGMFLLFCGVIFSNISALAICPDNEGIWSSAAPVPRLNIEKPIVVITTSYNNKRWVRKNANSILMQKYSNYRVIYIDDCSQDGTADIVEEMVNFFRKKSQFTVIRNTVRKGALANIYEAVHSCKNNEIVVSLDGDDWFYDNRVLERINLVYSTQNVWLTHGTLLEYPHNVCAWSVPIPEEIIAERRFREYRCPSHLRTFYAALFKKIAPEDLKYEGEFYSMTWDQAMMFPMIEMAAERHAFIADRMYVYNMSNPINDNKVNPQLQRDLEDYIRALPPYPRLEEPLFS